MSTSRSLALGAVLCACALPALASRPPPPWWRAPALPQVFHFSGEITPAVLRDGAQVATDNVPMEAALDQLRRMPDTMVTYDKNPPVHTFSRNDVDHARYKLSNWGKMGRLANFYRQTKSATAELTAFKQRITDVTTNAESPVHAAMFNHRFGSVAAAAALPSSVPMLQHIPDHGKPHIGWYNSRMLQLKTVGRKTHDRFLAVNDERQSRTQARCADRPDPTRRLPGAQ